MLTCARCHRPLTLEQQSGARAKEEVARLRKALVQATLTLKPDSHDLAALDSPSAPVEHAQKQ